jgi:excisionase family DNA binding protein
MLKSVVREVADELLTERQFSGPINKPQQVDQPDRFLLRAGEAADRLAISERHLWKITSDGLLPCVRVGRLVRYSVESIEQWIRESESADAPETRPTVARKKRQPTSKPPTQSRNPKRKKSPKQAAAKSMNAVTSKRPKKKPTTLRHHNGPKTEDEKRLNPFDMLLKEIGVERDDLPALTNGDLMRIAEVDIPTLHGWIYLNRELPEEALEKLRCHFRAFSSDTN